MRKYQWYHTAMECGNCEHKFVIDGRLYWQERLVKCPKCHSGLVIVDHERDLGITEAIAERS